MRNTRNVQMSSALVPTTGIDHAQQNSPIERYGTCRSTDRLCVICLSVSRMSRTAPSCKGSGSFGGFVSRMRLETVCPQAVRPLFAPLMHRDLHAQFLRTAV